MVVGIYIYIYTRVYIYIYNVFICLVIYLLHYLSLSESYQSSLLLLVDTYSYHIAIDFY